MGAYGVWGHIEIWRLWTCGDPMDAHACQLHLKEYVRIFLSLDHEPCLSPKYRNGGQKTYKNA